MKQGIVNYGFIVLAFLLFYSCSAVKRPLATTNFKSVKYNSHVRLSKSSNESQQFAKAQKNATKTVQSFAKENVTEEISDRYASAEGKMYEKAFVKQIVRNELAEKTAKRNDLLKNISNIKIEERLSNSKTNLLQIRDYWWEDDIEDWPWLEIVLAVIAILIIAILVTIFVSVVGGLISSLLGIILLIAVAYILYTLWF
ncbi:MAG: hypothetical protein ACJAV5_001235 [Vicingaceae bacterium]|jgi:hypothetical protein